MTPDFTHANAPFLAGFPKPELFRRVYLGSYYPPFRDRIIRVKARCIGRGFDYWSEFGYRAMSLQAQLHEAWKAGKGGRAAPPGLSGHQYGIADDSTHDSDVKSPGLQPDWVPENYAVLGEEAKREGLWWGVSINDRPHVQDERYVDGNQLGVLLAVWKAAPPPEDVKLKAVWKYIDTH